jgi:S-adenosylmethionine:tRNA ribosyltransferase-isomerase
LTWINVVLHFPVLTRDFDFELPPELIAQAPLAQRDQSRLLVLHRAEGRLEHRQFPALLDYLEAGDVLVLNNSKVIPARLRALNAPTGGQFEILLLEENARNDWWVMLRPGKRARLGTRLQIKNRAGHPAGIEAAVLEKNSEGHCRLAFVGTPDIAAALEGLGEAPLPPYIKRAPGTDLGPDLARYQTVYAQSAGSVAAPTAGLHFTEALLGAIRAKGVAVGFVTLHVGLGTFAPVKAEQISDHPMHAERYEISPETAALVNAAQRERRRVFAVGTTSVRVLESVAAANEGQLAPGAGRTRIYIYPPWRFRMVDGLLTNFHLPRSTLVMLASAFAAPGETRGREVLLEAYAAAVRQGYRFFSYGDAMLMV